MQNSCHTLQKSNLAESRHEERNKNFELTSRNTRFACNGSAYRKMAHWVTMAQENVRAAYQGIAPPLSHENIPLV